jgi:hypothetical protein
MLENISKLHSRHFNIDIPIFVKYVFILQNYYLHVIKQYWHYIGHSYLSNTYTKYGVIR